MGNITYGNGEKLVLLCFYKGNDNPDIHQDYN